MFDFWLSSVFRRSSLTIACLAATWVIGFSGNVSPKLILALTRSIGLVSVWTCTRHGIAYDTIWNSIWGLHSPTKRVIDTLVIVPRKGTKRLTLMLNHNNTNSPWRYVRCLSNRTNQRWEKQGRPERALAEVAHDTCNMKSFERRN